MHSDQKTGLNQAQKDLILATVPILREGGVTLTKYFYNRMFSNHPELRNLFNMGNQRNGSQPTVLAMSVLAYAEHIANPMALAGAVNTIGHKHASLNVTPEQYAIVGENLLASIQEVLGPEIATPAIVDAWGAAYQQLADLMIGVEEKMYEEKKALDGGWIGWRKFIVQSKVQESEEITSFYLYPKDGKTVSIHQPGQYLSLRLYVPELDIIQPRQYSISSAPNNEYYRISVKREASTTDHAEGMVSNQLHHNIKEGDSVELASPSGNVTLKDNQNTKVFISGGVGITPLISMASKAIAENQNASITWIQAFRNPKVQAFKNQINEWEKDSPNFKAYTFYDQDGDADAYQGQLDLAKISAFSIDPNADYYICGPTPFIQKQSQYLKDQGVKEDQIAFEQFGPHTLSF